MGGFVLLALLWNVCNGQGVNKGSIAVQIRNAAQQSLGNATLELLKAADTSLLKIALADKDGSAQFHDIPYGTYRLRVTQLSHQPLLSEPFILDQPALQLPALTLEEASKEMGSVTVTARKPFIQKLTDRIVVNVESSILSTGSTAFEVLERAPGVNIDPNDIISLRGRSGVIIMVDGKITAMTGQDLANFLRGLPSSAIERIEIITNPSAKYDAAGNSGIIDIRLKKRPAFWYQRHGNRWLWTGGLSKNQWRQQLQLPK